MNPVSYSSSFLHLMLLREKGALGRKSLQNCFFTVTFPADVTGAVGWRGMFPSSVSHISDNSHDSIHTFLQFVALLTANENKRIPAIQKLVAISFAIKLIPTVSLRNHNNYLKNKIILGAFCGCENKDNLTE